MAAETPDGSKVNKDDSGAENHSLELIQNDRLFIERFSSLYNTKRLSDLVLIVGDDRFYAHRFILTVSSDVFEAMLNEDRWKESRQPEVKLTEEEECIPVFPVFLRCGILPSPAFLALPAGVVFGRYLYTGSIGLTTDKVLPILLLADKYNISSLSQMCVEYMTRHIVESPDTNRTLSWYQYSKMTENTILVDKCRKFILSNFDLILKTSDWTELSLEEVVEFLSSSDLVVSSEFDLWQKLEEWLRNENNCSSIEKNIKVLLPLLRFTMIQPEYLLQIEGSELYKNYKELFSEKLSRAYRYHSLTMGLVPHREREERFRNYTCSAYNLCVDLTLLHYLYVEKHESKMLKRVSVPVDVISSSNQINTRQVDFEVIFWPKGPYRAFNWYSNTGRVTLTVRRTCKVPNTVKTSLCLVLFGISNSVRYVAFTYANEHKFTASTSQFIEDNVISLENLKDDVSPYLVHGNLEAKLFIKIENAEWD